MTEREPGIDPQDERLSEERARNIALRSRIDPTGEKNPILSREKLVLGSIARLFGTLRNTLNGLDEDFLRNLERAEKGEGLEKSYETLKAVKPELEKSLNLVNQELSYFDQEGQPISPIDKIREERKAEK